MFAGRKRSTLSSTLSRVQLFGCRSRRRPSETRRCRQRTRCWRSTDRAGDDPSLTAAIGTNATVQDMRRSCAICSLHMRTVFDRVFIFAYFASLLLLFRANCRRSIKQLLALKFQYRALNAKPDDGYRRLKLQRLAPLSSNPANLENCFKAGSRH